MALRSSLRRLPTAHWHCPSCGDQVPRLLPNGQRNVVDFAQQAACLPGAEKLVACRLHQHFAICLSCHDVWQELLGTLVVPEWQQGSLFESPGVADTAIIAALTLHPDAEEASILIASVNEQGFILQEECTLSTFDSERLTYPSERGNIAPLLWQRYQDWLLVLRARYPNDEENYGK